MQSLADGGTGCCRAGASTCALNQKKAESLDPAFYLMSLVQLAWIDLAGPQLPILFAIFDGNLAPSFAFSIPLVLVPMASIFCLSLISFLLDRTFLS